MCTCVRVYLCTCVRVYVCTCVLAHLYLYLCRVEPKISHQTIDWCAMHFQQTCTLMHRQDHLLQQCSTQPIWGPGTQRFNYNINLLAIMSCYNSNERHGFAKRTGKSGWSTLGKPDRQIKWLHRQQVFADFFIFARVMLTQNITGIQIISNISPNIKLSTIYLFRIWRFCSVFFSWMKNHHPMQCSSRIILPNKL